jgi:TM2 domain-containing membrane protein YozV
MSAQFPDDDGRFGGYVDGEPVDPYGAEYQSRRLVPPPPPSSASVPDGQRGPDGPYPSYGQQGQQIPEGYPSYGRPAQYGQPAQQGPDGYPYYGRPAQYGQQGYPHYAYPAYVVAPKSPALAVFASFFIPGLGSMINGDVGKGIGILIGYVVSAVLAIVVIGFVGMLVFWVWGMVDGYNGAQRWNARHGIIS